VKFTEKAPAESKAENEQSSENNENASTSEKKQEALCGQEDQNKGDRLVFEKNEGATEGQDAMK